MIVDSMERALKKRCKAASVNNEVGRLFVEFHRASAQASGRLPLHERCRVRGQRERVRKDRT